MIYTGIPYALDMNLGGAYNEFMDRLPEDAWACFLDHDAMWTTRNWYRQLAELVTLHPDGAFTAVTNRIGAYWQKAAEADPNNHDMKYHRDIGKARLARRTLLDVSDTMGWGGVVMCLSKKQWRYAGFFKDGMLCVDHQMHFGLVRAGFRIYLAENLYVYHWRRAYRDELPEDTPKVECECRAAERPPLNRIEI